MENLSWQSVITAAIVIGILLTAYNLIMSAVKNHREQSAVRNQPLQTIRSDIAEAKECLDRDKRRLDAHDKDIAEMRDGMNVIIRSMLALMRHEQHGNNIDGLRESENEINDYLTRR